ncbi:MAG: hypothetical protein IPJ19_12580 [Planctomycetes bacterium]|nr:hypothetical protein [Planctomycetota bacterium]
MKSMLHSARTSRTGLTLLEVVVSTAVMTLVLLSVALVTKTGNEVFRSTLARDTLRQRAQLVVARMVDELSTASKATFSAAPSAPFGSSTLDFRTPTGIAGGVVSWGPKLRICYELASLSAPHSEGDEHEHGGEHAGHAAAPDADGRIVLVRDPDGPSQVETVLATHVAACFEGETANGKDDNGNGLIDEKGLSFLLVGDQLTIRVTLADLDPDGNQVWVTSQTQVRLRN